MRFSVLAFLACAAGGAAVEIRGFSVWDDLSCRGETAREVPFAVPTLDSCASFCASFTGCGAFEYSVVRSYCSLKASCVSFASQALTVTGVALKPQPETVLPPPPPPRPQPETVLPPPPEEIKPFRLCSLFATTSGQCTREEESRTRRLDGNEFECRVDPCWLDVTQLGVLSDDGGRDYRRRHVEFFESDEYALFSRSHTDMDMSRARANFLNPDEAEECASTSADGSEGCPKGWVMCRGDCYMTIARNSRSPDAEEDVNDSAELRCLACGGGRVALVNTEDPKMIDFAVAMMKEPGANTQRRAAVDSDSTDGLWVRAELFNDEPFRHRNQQPWLAYTSIGVAEDNGLKSCPGGPDGEVARSFDPPDEKRTYKRILKDGSVDSLNQEAWHMCVTNPDLATELSEEVRVDCDSDPNHLWSCNYNYPCPGC